MRPPRIRRCSVGLLTVTLLCPAVAHAQLVEDDAVAIHTLVGENFGDQFGWIANPIPDVTGDGIAEFLATAPTADPNGSNSGRIYIYNGATGAEIWRADGASSGMRLGADADGGAIVLDPGRPAIIAGAPSSGAGSALVYDAATGELLHTIEGENTGDQFGFATVSGGDFDGDGRPDILVSARWHDANGNNAGRAYVFSGVDFSLICVVDGPAANATMGSSAAFVGDINNDSRDDFVVGAAGIGRAYVWSWDGDQCNLVHTLIPTFGVSFGTFFADGNQDVDADGTPDIYIGDFSANRAWIFSGVDGSIIRELDGEGEGGQFGIGRLIPDINNDGHADTVQAAWVSSQGANGAGKTFIYSGKDSTILQTMTYTVPGAGFGFDAAGMMGDVDGDGGFDFLITAASEASSTGKVFVMAGINHDTGLADLTDFQIVFGSHIKGGIEQLHESDDEYLRARSKRGFTAFEPNVADLVIGAMTTTENAATFDLTIEARVNNPGGTAKIRFRNWDTNGFDQVAQYALPQVDDVREVVGIDASAFVRIDDGRLELSSKHVVIAVFSAIGFDSFYDLVELGVN